MEERMIERDENKDGVSHDPPDIKTKCNAIRGLIKNNAIRVKELENDPFFSSTEGREGKDTAEIWENITLAYRHLEDARMRIGKVLQAYNGGVSVYDKNQNQEVKT